MSGRKGRRNSRAMPSRYYLMRVSMTRLTDRITVLLGALGAVAGLPLLSGDALGQSVGNTIGEVSDHQPMAQRQSTLRLNDEENFNEPLLNRIENRSGTGEEGPLSEEAQREITRRMELTEQARALMESADKLAKEGEYEAAVGEYRTALDVLPDSARTQYLRNEITAKYADASVELASQRASEGRYDEAISLCETVLAPSVSPNHGEAQILLKQLQDPRHFNPALTPEHIERVKRVEEALVRAMGFYDLGDFDSAENEYFKVLNIDRYNTGARRGLEGNENAKTEYYKSAYDQTRSMALRELASQWETKVPQIGLDQLLQDQRQGLPGSSESGVAYISAKLKEIIIPVINFRDTPLETAVAFLRQKSVELDTLEDQPARKGINIIIQEVPSGGASSATDLSSEFGATGGGGGSGSSLITLNLTNVPLIEALKYVTELAGKKYKIEPYAVKIVPLSDIGADLFTSVFSVPPTFLTIGGDSGGGGGAAPEDPLAAPTASGGGTELKARPTAKEVLLEKGISFPPGSSAFFNPTTSQLVVRNTQSNMELIETFVDSLVVDVQKQIYITSKFLEIGQNNLEELSFDYLLGGLFINDGQTVAIGGGTQGVTRGNAIPNPLDFPVLSAPQAGAPPAGAIPGQGGPVTSGLRSGDLAISQNTIDALIANAASGTQAGSAQRLGPAVFSLAGVFTDPQFQAVMRAVDQKTGVDLLSAPSITARSGQRAKVEVIREFIYPTEYDPPEIPDRIGTDVVGIITTAGSSTETFPVTPANPTAFETRNTGVSLEVDPVIGSDGYTIDLNLAPEVVEFKGFVNYGSPIKVIAPNGVFNTNVTVGVGAFAIVPRGSRVEQLTANQILMPVFETRKTSTSVTLWDGQTVALGGLMREDVESVNDKVPILGDVPVFGRFFRSRVDQRNKQHLSIFVTANLIDPAGQRIRPAGGNAEVGGPEVGGEVSGEVIGSNPLIP